VFPLTVEEEPGSLTHRPLATFADTTRDAVHEVLDDADLHTRYKGIARLSGHLAVMCRTVFPQAGREPGIGVELKMECLSRSRELLWTMRGLECHLSGCTSAAGRPVLAVSTALGRQLDGYWPAERALVGCVEDQLSPADRDRLAHAYWRALGQAPTRPHPRCPRSGPMRHVTFWWHGRWDRLLDGVDSRAGVGRDFARVLAQPPATGADDDAPGQG
jgi:hypothetical protein